jgi:hypothetical protein
MKNGLVQIRLLTLRYALPGMLMNVSSTAQSTCRPVGLSTLEDSELIAKGAPEKVFRGSLVVVTLTR